MCLSTATIQVQVPAGLQACFSASPVQVVQGPCMAPHLTANLRRMLAKISWRQMSSSQVALCNMTRLHPAVLSSSRPLLALKVSGQGSLIFGNVFSDEGCIVAKSLPAAVSAQQIASPGQKDSASDKRGWISAIAVILTAPSGLCSMMLC